MRIFQPQIKVLDFFVPTFSKFSDPIRMKFELVRIYSTDTNNFIYNFMEFNLLTYLSELFKNWLVSDPHVKVLNYFWIFLFFIFIWDPVRMKLLSYYQVSAEHIILNTTAFTPFRTLQSLLVFDPQFKVFDQYFWSSFFNF